MDRGNEVLRRKHAIDAGVGLPVHFDGSALMKHRRSGISRYLSELVHAFDVEPGLGIRPVTPYRFVSSAHVRGGRFVSLPVPRRLREPLLRTLNARSSYGEANVFHFPLYDRTKLGMVRAKPSVTTVYDFTFELMPHLFGDVAEELEVKRLFLEGADVLTCISEATAADLRRVHPDLDKPLVVTHLGAGEEFFRATDRPVRGLPNQYLLNVGNRAEHKNVHLLIAGLAEIAAEFPDLHLVLSGAGLPGELEGVDPALRERIHVVKASDRILPRLYRGASAFVFPSRYEGFGLPLVEAMAAGAPSIVSDAPALIEVAGGACEVTGVDDVAGMAQAISKVVGDSRHARALREAGRLRAADFTWQKTARATADAYRLAATRL